jgi:TRAP-type C4-dicarboxylate transport system permease small subunit
MTGLDIFDFVMYYVMPVGLTITFILFVYIMVCEAREAYRQEKRAQREQQIH